MSTSENISLWKKKAEIDYIALFMSLWLSLNAWMRDRYIPNKNRDLIELLKWNENDLKDEFSRLMHQDHAKANTFRGYFSELFRALNDAEIFYGSKLLESQRVSFEYCAISWNDGNPELESIRKFEAQHNKIEIDENLWVDDDNNRLFAAYIEILYQVRCALFHGDLAPMLPNERVIKALYLTLSMVMVGVGK